MSFLGVLDQAPPPNPYVRFGYLQNPFPVRGQVFPEIYHPRKELAEMQSSLVSFLRSTGPGRMWAIEGEAGLGKTNFLDHLDWDLSSRRRRGEMPTVRHLKLKSQQVSPRSLAQLLVQAIGEQDFSDLLHGQKVAVPPHLEGSDLHKFLETAANGPRDRSRYVQFLVRWLGGHQTYAWERSEYGVAAKERLAPAVGFVYLRFLLDELAARDKVKQVVLLLDEFEDIQAMRQSVETDYVMTLKGMVNAFNWERLFVVVAGTEGAFTTLGSRYPSLQSRWTRVRLFGVQSAEDAVQLTDAYRTHFRKKFSESNNVATLFETFPANERVQLIYLSVTEAKRSRTIPQRDLLHALHDWTELQLH